VEFNPGRNASCDSNWVHANANANSIILQTLIAIDSERIRRGHGIGLVVDTDLMIWKFTSAIVVGVEEFVVRVLFLFLFAPR
jgi:hypothetical protein